MAKQARIALLSLATEPFLHFNRDPFAYPIPNVLLSKRCHIALQNDLFKNLIRHKKVKEKDEGLSFRTRRLQK